MLINPYISYPVNSMDNFINVALASNGSTATASSTFAGDYPTASLIDGVRHTNNAWSAGKGWNSLDAPTGIDPEWVEIDFGQMRNLSEINVFTLADAINYNVDPSPSDIFTLYGVIDFEIHIWDGIGWSKEGAITANNLVWVNFPLIVTTNKIRILITNGGGGYARLVAVEAWGNN